MGPSVKAGAASGLVGTISFWAFHTVWIADVPVVLVEGAAWGMGGGAAVGWAFHHLHVRAGFPADWRGGLLMAVTMWLLLAPYEVLGLVFGPFTHLTRPTELAAIAPVGFVGVPVAALLGWALTHDRRATVALAVASGVMHFMMGGSLVYFGGRGPLLVLFAMMLPTYAVGGIVLVRVRRALLAHPTDDDSEQGSETP